MNRVKTDIEIQRYRPADEAELLCVNSSSFVADWGEYWTGEDIVGALSLPGVWALLARDAAGQGSPGQNRPGQGSLGQGSPAWGGPEQCGAGFLLCREVLDECEILLLGVVPELRGHGVAARLLQAFLDEMAQRKHMRVFLEVRENNLPALKLYTRSGFREVGRRGRYYKGKNGQYLDALTFALDIKSIK